MQGTRLMMWENECAWVWALCIPKDLNEELFQAVWGSSVAGTPAQSDIQAWPPLLLSKSIYFSMGGGSFSLGRGTQKNRTGLLPAFLGHLHEVRGDIKVLWVSHLVSQMLGSFCQGLPRVFGQELSGFFQSGFQPAYRLENTLVTLIIVHSLSIPQEGVCSCWISWTSVTFQYHWIMVSWSAMMGLERRYCLQWLLFFLTRRLKKAIYEDYCSAAWLLAMPYQRVLLSPMLHVKLRGEINTLQWWYSVPNSM